MKKVSQKLLNHLNSAANFNACDLYEITLYSGAVYRWADFDKDVALPDGRVFMTGGPIFERENIKISSGQVVDTMTITVHADGGDKIGLVPFIDLAHSGGLDDAVLTLIRCFFDEDWRLVDTLELFTGEIDTPEGGGLEIELKVKSIANRLNVEYPNRSYLTGCPYSVYDSFCGLQLAAFTRSGTVTAGTLTSMTSNLTFTDGYYDQGGADFLSGALAGLSAPVKHSAQNGFTFLIPLPAAPQPGDKFKVYPGCDKRPETCRDKFNNWSNNRATPYIPLPKAFI